LGTEAIRNLTFSKHPLSRAKGKRSGSVVEPNKKH
jgi:hypothetical protein